MRGMDTLAGKPAPATPALLDAKLDRRLRRDGFVKVRVLTAQQAGELRSHYGQLHGWSGEGFEVDFWNDDERYRARASEAIAEAVDEPLSALFRGYRPFLRNYLVKWPGAREENGFPEGPHRDWMYTDERAGQRSYVAWIALEDITGHNGQLRVVRGSHQLDDALRGTNIVTPWLEDPDPWNERMVSVPVLAGEAVITDAATVHGSYFNLTDAPRVVAAVAMAPAAASLVHYRNTGDDDAAERFDVDESFFVSQSAPGLLVEPPDRPSPGVEPIRSRHLAPRAMAATLDRRPLALVDRAAARVRGRG